MEERRQCCAPVSVNKRCPELALGNSDHCPTHRQKAKTLYLRYKSLCIKVDKFKCSSDAQSLSKYYTLLEEAYEARKTHRLMAYVPECHDYGHNKQFEILRDKISQCERSLKLLNETKISSEEESDTEIYQEVACPEITPNPYTAMKRFKKKRMRDEQEELRLLDQYIEANKEIYEQKRILVNILDELTTKLTNYFCCSDNTELMIIKIAFWNLLRQLYISGFFLQDFKIYRCDCCDEPSVMDISPLHCNCMNRLTDSNFRFFIDRFTIDTLEKAKFALTTKLGALCLLVHDLIDVYKRYGTNFVLFSFYLTEEKGRLCLIY